MSNTGLEFADRTVQRTHEWINDVLEHSGRQEAQNGYRMLRGVLHVLRDRLTVEEAAQLGAQLPMLIRGFYYEGWKPSAAPVRIRAQDEFVAAVRDELFDNPQIDPKQAIEAVFHVLDKRIAAGEIEDIRGMMPEALRGLWPKH